MKLEASPLQEASVGMAQIQSQLANLTLQLQDIKKEKEIREEVWSTKCRTKGHSKEHFPVYAECLAAGAPNPLPQLQGPWCEICKNKGHRLQECPLLQKYVQTTKNLYCNFCKSVGHDENHCRAYDLMKERTQDVYVMQAEQQNHGGNVQFDQGRIGHSGFRGYG